MAAIFRRAGFNAAVWARIEDAAHQPDEYCLIDNLLGDAKVFAHVFAAGLSADIPETAGEMHDPLTL